MTVINHTCAYRLTGDSHHTHTHTHSPDNERYVTCPWVLALAAATTGPAPVAARGLGHRLGLVAVEGVPGFGRGKEEGSGGGGETCAAARIALYRQKKIYAETRHPSSLKTTTRAHQSCSHLASFCASAPPPISSVMAGWFVLVFVLCVVSIKEWAYFTFHFGCAMTFHKSPHG